MKQTARAALWLAVLLFAGCKTARTEVLVVVGTDLDYGPGRTVQSVEIEVRSGDSHGPVREHRVVDVGPDGAGLAAMPLSFGLQPLPGSTGAWVRVRACGHDRCQQPEGALVERSAAVGFSSGQTRVLNIRLDARCAFVRCAQDQTCDPAVGYCASEVVPASALAAYEQDAGASAGAVPELSAGGGYSCLRRADGTVRCWGGAGRVLSYEALTPAGVLPANTSTPAEVTVGGPVERVDVGYGHACAVRADGAVACWGDNALGQLGDGTREPRNAAVTVAGIADAVEVRAGQGFSCARTRDGSVWCWGRLAPIGAPVGGVVSETVLIDSPLPLRVDGLADAVEIAAGIEFVCARWNDGSVRCWGGDTSGQLGGAAPGPVRVPGLETGAAGIAAGGEHACARMRDGTVRCWGNNVFGQLGNGTTLTAADQPPSIVAGLTGVVSVDAGRFHTCARMHDGSAACWGRNDSGQLGDGTREGRVLPVAVAALSGVGDLSVGAEQTCVRITRTGGNGADDVRCWGSDAAGELGSGRTLRNAAPSRVGGGSFTQVAAFGAQTCGLRDGVPVCWGLTRAGEGTGPRITSGLVPDAQEGPRESSARPLPVPGLPAPVVDVGGSYKVTCPVLGSGEVLCLGDNRFGELGSAAPDWTTTPQGVTGLTDVVQVARGGSSHECALRSDGSVWCWGLNVLGAVGVASGSDVVTEPSLVQGLPEIRQVGGGDNFSCARAADGRVFCWGINFMGQLGTGMPSEGDLERRPVPVVGLTDAVEIAVGKTHACARRATGSVVCWGSGASAELGTEAPDECATGTDRCARAPVAVEGLPAGRAVVGLAAGQMFSCAVLDDGSAWCWGQNTTGQLGVGRSSAVPLAPTQVASASHFVELEAGDVHACGRTREGRIECWGNGYQGQLGTGSAQISTTPLGVDLGDERAVAVRATPLRSCAVTARGALLCWGDDLFGQVGDGTHNPVGPVVVPGIADATDVAAGDLTGCATLGDGTVTCWGPNYGGRLGRAGDGTIQSPGAVAGLADAGQVDSAFDHSCAARRDGTVACWGANPEGALGPLAVGSVAFTAVDVPGIANVREVRVGARHSCARDADGAVFCWGSNGHGELGAGTTVARSATPTRVLGLPPALGLDLGDGVSCAWTQDGRAYCWGSDAGGALGYVQTCAGVPCSYAPTDVGLPGRVVQVAVYTRHACAVLDANGERLSYCWGANNAGQLGNGLGIGMAAGPTRVAGITHVAQVAVGDTFSCARLDDGSVQCWGDNTWVQTGTFAGTGIENLFVIFPTPVPALGGVEQLAAGSQHACARTSDGTVQCWGSNLVGQLGLGTTQSRTLPGRFLGLGSVASVQPGFGFGCALVDGGVRCRGANLFGQLGVRDERPENTVQVPGLTGVTSVTAGNDHACALLDGGIECWGSNQAGALGVGSFASLSEQPLQVASAWGPVQLSAGGRHTCGISAAGAVYCWGSNADGQLGYLSADRCPVTPCPDLAQCNSTPCNVSPGALPALPGGALQVSAGGAHSCAVTRDGAVYCWGRNGNGQLGNGTFDSRSTPLRVDGLPAAIAVSAGTDTRCRYPTLTTPRCNPSGEDHSCAITTDGAVWCWGHNDRGQLGVEAGADHATPVQVLGLPSDTRFVEVAAGGAHTCARAEDGTLWCWGDNGYGQLADGTAVTRTEPVMVGGL